MDEDRNELFPIMRTDITVEKSDKKTIIDTKFYKDIFSYNYEKPKFLTIYIKFMLLHKKLQKRKE